MNPFNEIYDDELAKKRKTTMPVERARELAFCAASHAAYVWAFHDNAGFNPNDLACVCGLHKERLK